MKIPADFNNDLVLSSNDDNSFFSLSRVSDISCLKISILAFEFSIQFAYGRSIYDWS